MPHRKRQTPFPLKIAGTLLVGLLAFAALATSYWDAYQDLETTREAQALNHLKLEYDALRDYQRQLAEQVFNDRLDTPIVRNLMAWATATNDPRTLERLRHRLEQELNDLYPRLRERGFRQFHFHLPGAVSFLRFHRPEKFGDDLWDIRQSLRQVNETHEPVHGFEEGRIFNGFRHIFPIFHDGRFVGSVEVSHSFRAFLNHHADLDHGVYRLLIDEALVQEKVWFGERQAHYATSHLHPRLLIDRLADPAEQPTLMPQNDWFDGPLARIDKRLAPRIREPLEDRRAFAVSLVGPTPLVAAFMPVENTMGDPVAYIARYTPAPVLATGRHNLVLKLAATAALILLAASVILVLQWRERGAQLDRERLLRSLQEKAHSLGEAQRIARLGNWEWDVSSEALHWSDEVFRIFGLEPDTVDETHEAFLQAVHPDDREAFNQSLQAALTNGQRYELEHRIVRPDGSIRLVQERATIQRDENAKPVRMVGTVQDVTEQRMAEEELRQAHAIVESAHEGIMVTDENAHIISANPAFTRLTGYPEDEVIGETASILKSNRHDRKFYQGLWQSLQDNGSWEGEIWNRHRDGSIHPQRLSITSFTTDWGERRYVGLLTDISIFKEREQKMWRQAHHDALTGLPNRLLLRERLTRAIIQARRHHDRLALLFVDLDDFKPINDRFGHAAGDAVLEAVAERMQDCVRESDTVARLAGDEFAILIDRISNDQSALVVARKLQEAITEAVEWDGHTLRVTASIGMATYPDHGDNARDLLDAADQAMYHIKRAGKGGVGHRRVTNGPVV